MQNYNNFRKYANIYVAKNATFVSFNKVDTFYNIFATSCIALNAVRADVRNILCSIC